MKALSAILLLVLAAAVHAEVTDFSPAYYPTIPVEQTIDINGTVHVDEAGVGVFTVHVKHTVTPESYRAASSWTRPPFNLVVQPQVFLFESDGDTIFRADYAPSTYDGCDEGSERYSLDGRWNLQLMSSDFRRTDKLELDSRAAALDSTWHWHFLQPETLQVTADGLTLQSEQVIDVQSVRDFHTTAHGIPRGTLDMLVLMIARHVSTEEEHVGGDKITLIRSLDVRWDGKNALVGHWNEVISLCVEWQALDGAHSVRAQLNQMSVSHPLRP